MACLFSGCATWAQHGVTAARNKKFRIAVLPIVVTAEIDKLSDIMTAAPVVADENKSVQTQMKNVAEQLSHDLNTRLHDTDSIEIVPLESPEIDTDILASIAPPPWSPEEFDKLKIRHDVQAVLLVKLAGYGKMKKKWLTYLIGSGMVEAVVQGVLAAKLVHNTWVGIAFAVEEAGQEILVWGGGSYLFNKHYAPVTLEAELVSRSDGKSIWDDTVFVSVDKKAIEALAEEDRKKKQIQLYLTAKKALDEVASDLDKAAKRNISTASDVPDEANNTPANNHGDAAHPTGP